MDFIIEIISEIFFEGFVEFAKSKKAPKLFRFLVFTFLLFIAGILLYSSYAFKNDFGLMLFTGLMSLTVFAYTIKIGIQVKKSN